MPYIIASLSALSGEKVFIFYSLNVRCYENSRIASDIKQWDNSQSKTSWSLNYSFYLTLFLENKEKNISVLPFLAE